MRSRLKRPLWLIYLVVGYIGGLAYYFFPPVAKVGPLFNLLGISSVIAILVGVRLHRPAHRAPWMLFALGQALFIGGDTITYNYQAIFGHDIPFPSIGDVAYLAVYPCLIAGLLVMIRRRTPGRDRDSMLDSLVIAIGAGLLSWEFLMAPYAHDHTLSALVKATSMAYPLMDLILLAVVVRLAVGGGHREPAFYLLVVGAVALLATDAAYGTIQLSGVIYQNGGPLEAGWLSFYLLWGAAALHPSMRSMSEPVPRAEPKHPRRRLGVLAAVSLVSPGVNILQAFRGELLDPGAVSACSAAIFLLVFARMNGLMVDITEHRRTEAQLRETEAKYRNLVERLPAIVYIAEFGEQGRWLYVSPQVQPILGFTQQEWVARERLWHQQVHPDDLASAVAVEQRVLTTGEQLRCEYRIRARDGRLVWIREEAQALVDDQGRPAYLQGVMYDISEQKRAEETLREALRKEQKVGQDLRALNEMKNSFLQAVSHDLRTPLTSIMGSALTLNREDMALSDEDARGLMGGIASNAQKLNRLLTDLLDVDRLSRGIVEPQRKPVAIRELVDRVLRECKLEDHPVDVQVESIVVDVDPGQVERIVENLVINAVRYTPPGTPIWIWARPEGSGVLLAVEDAGPGVPPQMREAVFEAFRQGNEQVRHSPGVGIGLSLVARFAELHGGRAWVTDRAGGGASFRVSLPGKVSTDMLLGREGANSRANGFGEDASTRSLAPTVQARQASATIATTASTTRSAPAAAGGEPAGRPR